MQHVAEHGLSYGTEEEYSFRQAIFERKDKENDEINGNPENTFTVGHNFMSTWTDNEYEKLLGFKPSLELSHSDDVTILDTVNIPVSVDWRTKGKVNAVKNQGGCGSCWAFAATSSIESHHAIEQGKLISLAEQQLVDCEG